MGWSIDGDSPLVAVTPARPASPVPGSSLVSSCALCVLAAPERLLRVDVRTSQMSVPSAASREQ